MIGPVATRALVADRVAVAVDRPQPAVLRPGQDASPVRRPRQAERRRGEADDPDHAADPRLPDADRRIAAGRGERRGATPGLSGPEGERVHRAEVVVQRPHRPPGAGLPDPDRGVGPARAEPLAVGRGGQREHRPGVPFQGGHLAARRRVPDPHDPVGPRGGQPLAAVEPDHVMDGVGVPFEPPQRGRPRARLAAPPPPTRPGSRPRWPGSSRRGRRPGPGRDRATSGSLARGRRATSGTRPRPESPGAIPTRPGPRPAR